MPMLAMLTNMAIAILLMSDDDDKEENCPGNV